MSSPSSIFHGPSSSLFLLFGPLSTGRHLSKASLLSSLLNKMSHQLPGEAHGSIFLRTMGPRQSLRPNLFRKRKLKPFNPLIKRWIWNWFNNWRKWTCSLWTAVVSDYLPVSTPWGKVQLNYFKYLLSDDEKWYRRESNQSLYTSKRFRWGWRGEISESDTTSRGSFGLFIIRRRVCLSPLPVSHVVTDMKSNYMLHDNQINVQSSSLSQPFPFSFPPPIKILLPIKPQAPFRGSKNRDSKHPANTFPDFLIFTILSKEFVELGMSSDRSVPKLPHENKDNGCVNGEEAVALNSCLHFAENRA